MTPVIERLVKVDEVRAFDRAALLRLFEACSPDTVLRRFFAPLRQFPAAYLDGVLARRPAVHDALVLRYGDGLHLAGLASVVTCSDDRTAAELGVLVQDDWQGQGLGTALVEALLVRAVQRGVEQLAASVLPSRAGLLRVLARRLELLAVVSEDDYLTGHYRLPVEVRM